MELAKYMDVKQYITVNMLKVVAIIVAKKIPTGANITPMPKL
jgi:hypothetical protein